MLVFLLIFYFGLIGVSRETPIFYLFNKYKKY